MSNVAEGIKDLLVAAAVGTFNATAGWSIRLHKEEDKPNTHITIYNTGGTDPNPKWLLDFPSAQVRVRGAPSGYDAAFAKAKEIKDTLLGLPSQDVNGDRWDAVNMNGDINHIGYDENERPLFTLNFALIVEPENTAGDNREEL